VISITFHFEKAQNRELKEKLFPKKKDANNFPSFQELFIDQFQVHDLFFAFFSSFSSFFRQIEKILD